MADNITARDLMKRSFLRLGAEHTLREALGILLDPRALREGPRVLIALNRDASFAGTLTTRYLLKALVPEWALEEQEITDEIDFEKRLLASMPENLDLKVSDAMNRDVSTARPDDRLPRLIEKMHNKRLDCLPVIDNDRVLGIIYLSDVFNAAADLALASRTEADKSKSGA